MDRERLPDDLLVGALAVATGLVRAEDLADALGAWSAEGGRPLAEELASRGLIGEEERSALEAMAAAEASRFRNRPRPELETTVPDLEGGGEPIEWNRTEALHVPGAGAASVGADDGREDSPVGRFRILRPHAEGGLGVVSVALDTQLHREVALKQIHDRRADDPDSRSRFLREAEVTGGLEHPGIVPVYGLGRDRQGRPYYAMRLIRGGSLKQAIALFHADPELARDPGARTLALWKLLRRVTDVCNAIDYAHGRGVVHRDLKPSNVMVGHHGETLVVDWGLAKPLGRPESGVDPGSGEGPFVPSPSSGSAETVRGAALGTPAYMSPEQAAGDWDRLGARSDVYGLGATLYCVLTGKPPFDGPRGEDLLDRVRAGDFPPPRSRNPSIPRALEAVCLKAMAVRPDDRYGSARELADDIERWMADEPVDARPEPILGRLGRWGRRNRQVVAAAAVLLVASVAILAVDDARVGREKRDAVLARDLSREALKREEAALVESDRSFTAAYKSVYGLFTKLATSDQLARLPGAEELRQEVARMALSLVDPLLSLRPRDAKTRYGAWYIAREVGIALRIIGRTDEAGAACRREIEIMEGLADESPGDLNYGLCLASSWIDDGHRLLLSGRPLEAEASYRKGLRLAEEWAGKAPESPTPRLVRADARASLADAMNDAGRAREAVDAYEGAARDFLRALASAEAGPRDASNQSTLDADLARALRTLGQLDDAEAAARRSLARSGPLREKDPGDNDVCSTWAAAHVELGRIESSRPGRRREAVESFGRGIDELDRLARDFGKVRAYRHALGDALLGRGEAYADDSRADLASADWSRARATLETLLASSPGHPACRGTLGRVLGRQASLAIDRGSPSAAVPLLEAAVQHQQAALSAAPESRADLEALERHRTDLRRAGAASTGPAGTPPPRGPATGDPPHPRG